MPVVTTLSIIKQQNRENLSGINPCFKNYQENSYDELNNNLRSSEQRNMECVWRSQSTVPVCLTYKSFFPSVMFRLKSQKQEKLILEPNGTLAAVKMKIRVMKVVKVFMKQKKKVTNYLIK